MILRLKCTHLVILLIAGALSMCANVHAQQKVHISGYGNIHYMNHNGTPTFVGATPLDNGFLQLREFSLFFDFIISDAIIASTELEAGDNGNTYSVNYAYIDIQAMENLSFRIGKVLVPFLSYNENKPNFKQNLMSQPFTAWNLVPVNGVAILSHGFGWSDAGVTINWNHALGDVGLFDLKGTLINGLGSNSNVLDENSIQLDAGMMTPFVRPRDGLIQNEQVTKIRDNNNDKATVFKASFRSLFLPLDVGLSWYRGAWNPDGDKNLQMLGVHLNWLAQRFTIKGEYVKADVEQDAGFDPVAAAGKIGPAPLNTSTGDYSMKAFYIEGSFIPVRWPENRYLRLVARFDDVDTNDKIMFTPFDRSRITVGAEFQFARDTRFRYEWQRSTIDDFEKAPGPYKNAGGKENIVMHMASVIFSF